MKYGEEISISVSDDDFSQSKSKSLSNGAFQFDSNDDEFIEEEMLILVSRTVQLQPHKVFSNRLSKSWSLKMLG